MLLILVSAASVCTAESVPSTPSPYRSAILELLARYAQVQPAKPGPGSQTGPGGEEARASGGARIVHFPADRSLGKLYTQDAGTVREFTYWFHWTGTGEGEREYLCEAQGDVQVPAGKRLSLTVSKAGSRDLAALSQLRPDDLYGLGFEVSLAGSMTLPEGWMKHIAHLTGLKSLALAVRGLSHVEMESIKALVSLEYLHAPDGLTDAGLAYVAELPSLKGLYFECKDSRVTDAGLRHLSELNSIEELYLKGERMGDAGLAYLRDLPRLNYLCLYGSNFTDKGMVHVKQMSSLRILSFHENLCRITDTGLVHISQMAELEFLCLHGMKDITDTGIAHLSKMRSLKKLDIGSSQVTDRGLAYLAQIKTLEQLDLPQHQKGITDAGLAHIAELPNLKALHISRIHFNDPKMNKEYYTDKGLEDLVKCQGLEELSLGSIGITDAGMDHVAKLTALKSLLLFGCENITDNGLARLAELKSLTSLHIAHADITISGLNRLSSLSNLTRLNVSELWRGGAVLDLSGMTNLEDLILSFSHKSPDVFTDADLVSLAGLKRLKGLQIGPRGYTDKGVASLTCLVRLERLSIGGRGLTDEAFRHVGNMKRLQLLNVSNGVWDTDKSAWGSGGGFTDKALSYLEGLTQLNMLEISSDHVFSSAAVQRLRRALPGLDFIRVNTGAAMRDRSSGREGAPVNRQTPRPAQNR
jgi:Leucine-rich repeat (LRR) protein